MELCNQKGSEMTKTRKEAKTANVSETLTVHHRQGLNVESCLANLMPTYASHKLAKWAAANISLTANRGKGRQSS